MYTIFKTDNQHSHASKDLIGLAENKEIAIDLIREHAKKENEVLNTNDLFNLNNIEQTQGYKGSGEYSMRNEDLNTLF